MQQVERVQNDIAVLERQIREMKVREADNTQQLQSKDIQLQKLSLAAGEATSTRNRITKETTSTIEPTAGRTKSKLQQRLSRLTTLFRDNCNNSRVSKLNKTQSHHSH